MGAHRERSLTRLGGRSPFLDWRDDPRAEDGLNRILAFMARYDGVRSHGLTERELQVLRLVAAGLKNPAIAHELGISNETVKSHLRKLTLKLDAKNRTNLVAIAIRRGLID